MVNDNIITQKMYHKVRGIIRGELIHLSCSECKRQDMYSFCDCLTEGGVCFKPRDEYVDKIAKKICTTIGEPIEKLEYEVMKDETDS